MNFGNDICELNILFELERCLLTNSRVKLVPLDTIHDEYIIKWRNEPKLSAFLFSENTITLESHRKWYEKYKESDDREEFVIYVIDTNIPIGTIGLSSIDKANLKAEYGIIIGENDYIGKGYAKEASQLILKYAFDELHLNKVFLKVFDDNNRAIGMYNTLGFSIDGILRQDIFKQGAFHNVIEMSFLKKEWKHV